MATEERPDGLDAPPPAADETAANEVAQPEVTADGVAEVEVAAGAADVDLQQRFLCADGACIGVIGADGRCKVCSAPISPLDVASFEQAAGLTLGAEFERADAQELAEAARAEAAASPAWVPEPDEAPDLESRVLCSDGNCIGVIGPDNTCKECGSAYNPAGEQ